MPSTPIINSLIDKLDTKEILLLNIQQILDIESANQVQLATDAGQANPQEWALRVYTERSNPFELFRDESTLEVPRVVIFFDRGQEVHSNAVERSTETGTFAIEVYGAANSHGGVPADFLAAQRMERGIRLVRNILMDAQYDQLGAPRGQLVWRRRVATVETFRPPQESDAATRTIAARVSLEVTYNEYAGEYEPAVLEFFNAVISRSDGSPPYSVEFDYS